MKMSKIILSAAAASLLSTAVFGQALGDSAVDTRLETLNENIADDFERDTSAFGNEGRAAGYTGSLALQTSATSGNSDTSTVGVGASFPRTVIRASCSILGPRMTAVPDKGDW